MCWDIYHTMHKARQHYCAANPFTQTGENWILSCECYMGFIYPTTVTSVVIEFTHYTNDHKTYIPTSPQRKPEIISTWYSAEKRAEFVPTGTICAFMHSVFHITSDWVNKVTFWLWNTLETDSSFIDLSKHLKNWLLQFQSHSF